MFDDIGRKIKTLAKVVCWIGIIGSIISGLCIMSTGEGNVALGIIIAIVGPILSWISSFVLYGFGQLVENSDMIRLQNSKIIGENINLPKYKGSTTSTEESEGTSTTGPDSSSAKTVPSTVKTEPPIDDAPATPLK